MRVLVVEDSARLRESLVEGLSALGYAVDSAGNGRDALASARAIEYDAIVLDVMLPELDGLEVLREVRARGSRVPVLMLTARDRVEHRVEGLRSGADDYLVKPFAFEELAARLDAIRRRSSGHARNEIEIGRVRLDLGAKRFAIGSTPLELPPREYAILELLFLHAGRVLGRSAIEEHVYDSGRQVWSNAVDSAVASIRRRLADHGIDDLVRTRRGQGYIVERSAGGEGK